MKPAARRPATPPRTAAQQDGQAHRSPVTQWALAHVQALLARVLQFTGPADAVASAYFRANPKLGHRERGVVAEAVFAVLRRKSEFSHYAESGSGSIEHRLALLGLAAVFGTQACAGTATADDIAWLDRVLHIDPASLAPRIRANLPEWIYALLSERFGDAETQALAAALNQPAPLDCRVNTVKLGREAALSALAQAGVAAEPMPYAPSGLRLAGKPALQRLELFQSGAVEVQDEGSQLLCHLLAPKRGEMIVDFCAGAGGKTLALGAMMRSTGRLYAFDVSDRRLAKLKPRLARSGLSNVHPVLIDSEKDAKIKRLAGKIDRVLVDAPCSGLGTLRRNPDLKWRQTRDAVAELTAKQASILASAARLVRPSGRLVYATCSLLDAENRAVAEAFAAAHPDFSLLPAGDILSAQKIPLPMGPYLELLPHRHATDGFFAAVFERHAAQADAAGGQQIGR